MASASLVESCPISCILYPEICGEVGRCINGCCQYPNSRMNPNGQMSPNSGMNPYPIPYPYPYPKNPNSGMNPNGPPMNPYGQMSPNSGMNPTSGESFYVYVMFLCYGCFPGVCFINL